MEYPPVVTKTSYCRLDLSYIKQIQCLIQTYQPETNSQRE